MDLPKPLEELLEMFQKLPGVGKKTALRYTLYCLYGDKVYDTQLSSVLNSLKEKIKLCRYCYAPSEEIECTICSSHIRSSNVLCVIESYKDLIAIESTEHFKGKYHILGGVISPINGVKPEDIYIDVLIDRVKNQGVNELIMALNPTIDGDTTIYYISKLLEEQNVKISTISRGVSFGSEIDYTDVLTLGRSIMSRQPFEKMITK